MKNNRTNLVPETLAAVELPERNDGLRPLADDATTASDRALRFAQEAVDLFLEYRDVHGCDEAAARVKALTDIMEAINASPDLEGSLVKAYCITHNEAHVWTDFATNVVHECVDDGEQELLTLDQVKAMNLGDVLEVPGWKVECVAVDEEFLDTLPKHDGW